MLVASQCHIHMSSYGVFWTRCRLVSVLSFQAMFLVASDVLYLRTMWHLPPEESMLSYFINSLLLMILALVLR